MSNSTDDSSRRLGRGIKVAVTTAVLAGIIVGAWLIYGQPWADSTDSAPPEHDPGVPDVALAQGQGWQVVLNTSEGDIEFTLDGVSAPQATASFIYLANEGFFDGTSCHRLLPSALLQCGDPTASGTGGPGYSFGPIENAPSSDTYPAGSVAMARIGGDGYSMGSQFFLVFDDVLLPSDSAGGYTVMGEITEGLNVLAEVANKGTVDGSMDGKPLASVIIESVEVS